MNTVAVKPDNTWIDNEMAQLEVDLANTDKSKSDWVDREIAQLETDLKVGSQKIPSVQPSEEENKENYDQFTGERTWNRAAARSGKSVAAGVIGGTVDLATSPYNVSAKVSNAKTNFLEKNGYDPEAFAQAESMGGGIPYMPYVGKVPLIPSAVESVDKIIDQATEGYTATPEDEKYVQEGLKIAGSLGGGTAWASLAEKVGAKGISRIIEALSARKEFIKQDLISGFATGAATQKMQDQGYNAVESVAGGAAAGMLPALGTIFGKGAASKMVPMFGHSPKNYNPKYHEAAVDIGMGETAPTGLFNESTRFAGNEQILQRTPYFGSKHNRELKAANEEYVSNLKDSVENVGPKLSYSEEVAEKALDVGSAINTTFKEAKQAVEAESDKLYKLAAENIPQNKAISLPHVEQEIQRLREGLRSLNSSKDENYVKNWLDRLEGQMYDMGSSKRFGSIKNKKDLDIIDVIGTKRSLNRDINWNPEVRGVKGLMKRVKGAFDLDIEAYGQQPGHQEWYKTYKDADIFYGKYAGDETGLASDVVQSIIYQQDPDKILGKLTRPSEFKTLESFLGRTEGGKEFYNSIKREKLESIFAQSVKGDQVSWNNLSKSLKDPSKAVLIKHLAGEETYKKLLSFGTYAEGMSKRLARNPNASGSAHEGLVLGLLLGLVTGGDATLVTTGKKVAKAVAFSSALSWTVRNKKMMNAALNAAKASQEGRSKDVLKWGAMLDKSFTEEFGEPALKALAQSMAHQSAGKE